MTVASSVQISAGARMRGASGFTLVELMIALVIASILLSIAVAGYSSSIRKSRRTDAKTALLDLAGREERYFSINSTYTNDWAQLGYTGGTVGSALTVGNYNVSVANCTPAGTTLCSGASVPTFTGSATPAMADQQKDKQCQYFRVDQTGAQKSTDTSDGTGNDTTSTCWK